MAHRINIPGGPVGLHMGTRESAEREQAIIDARHAFAIRYATEQGWGKNLNNLSIAQIMEIRKQNGWKKPLAEDE